MKISQLLLPTLLVIATLAASHAQDEILEVRVVQAPKLYGLARRPDGIVWTMKFREAEAFCKSMGTRLPTARELARVAMKEGGAIGIRNTSYPKATPPNLEVSAEIEKMRWDKQVRYGWSPIFSWAAKGSTNKTRSYDTDEAPAFQSVLFYYSAEGFRPPENDPRNYCQKDGRYNDGMSIWSSSIVPAGDTREFDIAERGGLMVVHRGWQKNSYGEENGHAYALQTCDGFLGETAFWWPRGVRCIERQ